MTTSRSWPGPSRTDGSARFYGRGGRVVGALTMNMPAKVITYRRRIAEGLGWDEALAEAAVG
ncbi:MAG: hypothetical protein R2701_04300 [Acidimicrobiales bacterium]